MSVKRIPALRLPLIINGNNEICYTSVKVAHGLSWTYILVTNSCDFGVTEDICSEMTGKPHQGGSSSTNDRICDCFCSIYQQVAICICKCVKWFDKNVIHHNYKYID